MRSVTIHKFDHVRGVPVPGLWRKDVDSKDLLCLRQAGESIKSIAALFGIAKSTVCERLKRDFPKEYKVLRVIPSRIHYYALCARAYKLYQELGSYGKVAKALKCARTTVIGRVKFMGEIFMETNRESQDKRLYPVEVVEEDGIPVFVKPEEDGGLTPELMFPYPPSVTGSMETAYAKDILDDIEVVGNGNGLF